MKKKLCALTLFASILLLVHCNDVQAAEIKASDVPNNTYIIGTHMFSDEVVLTTKHIMLGATTIESDKLSDMTIYYKTPRGAWIDGLLGETITVPTKFYVDYIDTVLQVTNPVISSNVEISDTEDLHGKKYNLVLDKIDNMTGVQLYSSTKEDGEYKLVKDYKIDEITNNSIEVEAKGGYNYFYKIKTYKTVSETKYSEFSNVVNIDNSLLQPENPVGYGGYIPKEGEDQTLDTVLLFDIDQLKTALGNNPDGIEFYSSTKEDGEYKLVKTIAYEDLDVVDEYGTIRIPFALIPGYKNYFKIRSYITYGNEKVYSEYRNITYNGELSAPIISRFQPLSVNTDHLSYGVDIYLDNVYVRNFQSYPSGVDVLYSTKEDREYALLTSVALTNMTYSGEGTTYIANINVPVGNKYFIKLRKYVMVDGQKVEGKEYSVIEETAMYSITYNLDGGEFYYQEGRYNFNVYTENTEFTISMPRKDGYVFLGWTGSNGDIPQKEVTIDENTTGNLEYTANWALLGDVDEDGEINLKDKNYLLKYLRGFDVKISELISDLNQDGDIDDVDYMILSRYLVDDNIKLPYDSGKKYSITYNLEGGVNNNLNINKYASISLPFDLKEPTKEGYVFLGWTGSNGNILKKEVTIDENTTGNLEYKANWALLGDVDEDGEINLKDKNYLLKYLRGFDVKISELISDLNQDGDIDDVDYMILSRYLVDDNIKLPYDSGKKYSITYNLEGGVNNNLNINKYASISLPFDLKEPTKEGYVFLGWTGSNGNILKKEVTIDENTTGNLEYKANWDLLENN